MKTQSWLWPDRTIGKKESRVLREEHNAVVNLNADLLVACNQALEALRNVPFVGGVYDQQHSDTQLAADQSLTAAISKAEGMK